MVGRAGLLWPGNGSIEGRLETERLYLLPPRRRDLEALDEAILETLPELVQWLPWATPRHDRTETRRYIRGARLARSRRRAEEYSVVEREAGRLVGMVSVHRIDWARRSAGLGYWIRKSAWGRGYATEATRAAVEDAFRRLGLHRLEAHVATDNRASQRVPEKLGFQREGVAREAEYISGRFVDHIQYSLLRWELIEPDEGSE